MYMSLYKEMDFIHNKLLTKFHETGDGRYLGAANSLVEAINYVAEVENILLDKDYKSIFPSSIKPMDSTIFPILQNPILKYKKEIE